MKTLKRSSLSDTSGYPLDCQSICIDTGSEQEDLAELPLSWACVGMAFLVIDFMVRYQHYWKVGPTLHDPQVEQ